MSNFCDTCLLFWAMEIGNRLVGVPLLQNLNLDSTISLLSIHLRILFSKLFIKLVSTLSVLHAMVHLWSDNKVVCCTRVCAEMPSTRNTGFFLCMKFEWLFNLGWILFAHAQSSPSFLQAYIEKSFDTKVVLIYIISLIKSQLITCKMSALNESMLHVVSEFLTPVGIEISFKSSVNISTSATWMIFVQLYTFY